MKNKILNEKLITNIARETGVTLQDSKRIISCYFDNLKLELINGNKIITPLGEIFISERRLNTNISDKTITHKLNYKINKDFQKFLDSES